MKKHFTLLTFALSCTLLSAQSHPLEVNITSEGRLVSGGNKTTGFYDTDYVNKLEIFLDESNWFELLDGTGGPGGNAGETLVGSLIFNDTLILDSVLVSIKGQTSDRQNHSEKKSFKIEIDEIIDQDLQGYDNLNLNCAFQDHSSMREVLYYDVSRSFTPALKGSFIDLYINGQYWGPYNNIQQIEGRYIKEWFLNNEGTRWRALRVNGSGGGPGGGFGAGTSTLNYNGPDSSDYHTDYTLKKSNKENPWEDLIQACDDLNNLPIDNIYDELKHTLDIDRALWFLAQEVVFVDDDSYIHKGGMDYYVYWDQSTDRIIPLEVDGNSVLADKHVSWSPFYHADDEDFPLLHRLLQNTEMRQRYLAHLRTVLDLYFKEDVIHDRIDQFAAILDQRVQNDPKKIYSYNQFLNGVESLKNTISDRIEFLKAYHEIDRDDLTISELSMSTSEGFNYPPTSDEEVHISVQIEGDAQKILLYYGEGLDGMFERIEMYDDGMNGDIHANDNTYHGVIPRHDAGTFIRYYIEAIKNDSYSTATFYPVGAEHDVFIYQVQTRTSTEEIVINEFMANNKTTVSDISGEYDDWIELFNKGDETIDLSGYHLSDDEDELDKWTFPDEYVIEPNEYIIIWADDDEDQATDNEMHCNFKLSADGEILILSNSNGEIVDHIEFEEQQQDVSFARIPNGVGNFQFNDATFKFNNEGTTQTDDSNSSNTFLSIYPNPATDQIQINMEDKFDHEYLLTMFTPTGEKALSKKISAFNTPIDVSNLSRGIYFVCLQSINKDKHYVQRIAIL